MYYLKIKNNGFAVIIGIAISVLFLNSCKHEPLPFVLPKSDTIKQLQRCDSTKVYFVNDVMPYINATCAVPGCHDHNNPTAGIDLSSYDQIMKAKVKGKFIVQPGDPINSKLCRVLYLLDLIPMPPLYNFQIPSEGRDYIVNWVLDSARNEACEYIGDTMRFAYKKDVRPLIFKYCTGCHYGSYASDSIELVTYAQVKSFVDKKKLLESITGQEGVLKMPTGNVAMQPAEIIKIRKWIEDGAPFN